MARDDELQDDDYAFLYLNVDSLPVAWLAYRGVIASVDVIGGNDTPLSWFLLETIQRGLSSTLRREGRLEGARLARYPHCLSRLQSVFAFPSLSAAQAADEGRGQFHRENLVAIAPIGNVRREAHDMNIATDFDAMGFDAADAYWRGPPNANALPELLLQGRFAILGTALRQRAYEKVKGADPNALCMLELSRLAAEFGSDLGSITPRLRQDEDGITASYAFRFDEAEGMAVWQKALEEVNRDPNFPVDWAALEPLKHGPDPAMDDLFRVVDYRALERPFRVEKTTELYDAIVEVLGDR